MFYHRILVLLRYNELPSSTNGNDVCITIPLIMMKNEISHNNVMISQYSGNFPNYIELSRVPHNQCRHSSNFIHFSMLIFVVIVITNYVSMSFIEYFLKTHIWVASLVYRILEHWLSYQWVNVIRNSINFVSTCECLYYSCLMIGL